MPAEGELSALRVNVDEALPLAGTATGLGRFTETPAGATPLQDAERLTVDAKPSIDESIIVADCDVSGPRVIVAGDG